jgi:hypothetical protein
MCILYVPVEVVGVHEVSIPHGDFQSRQQRSFHQEGTLELPHFVRVSMQPSYTHTHSLDAACEFGLLLNIFTCMLKSLSIAGG